MTHQDNKNLVASSVTSTFVLGVIVFVVLLLVQARGLGQSVNEGVKTVALAPLHLMELQKTAVDGGHSISFQLKSGMLIYFVLVIVLGFAIGYMRNRSKNPRDEQ